MTQKCEYAGRNEFGRIICTVDDSKDSQLCIFQRYCTKACEWQNSKAFSTCERRREMAKNKSKAIKVENEQVENVRANAYKEDVLANISKDNEADSNADKNKVDKIELKKEIETVPVKKEKKRTGTVISVSKISIIVEDENGNGYTLFNHPEAKYGDIIEF